MPGDAEDLSESFVHTESFNTESVAKPPPVELPLEAMRSSPREGSTLLHRGTPPGVYSEGASPAVKKAIVEPFEIESRWQDTEKYSFQKSFDDKGDWPSKLMSIFAVGMVMVTLALGCVIYWVRRSFPDAGLGTLDGLDDEDAHFHRVRIVSWNVLSLSTQVWPFEQDPPSYMDFQQQIKKGHIAVPTDVSEFDQRWALYDVIRTFGRDTITGNGVEYTDVEKASKRKNAQKTIEEYLQEHLNMKLDDAYNAATFPGQIAVDEDILSVVMNEETLQMVAKKAVVLGDEEKVLEALHQFRAKLTRRERLQLFFKMKPFEFLAEDRAISFFYDDEVNRMTMAKAYESVTALDKQEEGYESLATPDSKFDALQDMACKPLYTRTEKRSARDWLRFKMFFLMWHAAVQAVLKFGAGVQDVKSWHPFDVENAEGARLKVSLEIVGRMSPEERKATWTAVRQEACQRLQNAQDEQGNLLNMYLVEQEPQIAFFQDVHSSLIDPNAVSVASTKDSVKGMLRSAPEEFIHFVTGQDVYGDNAVALVTKTFLKRLHIPNPVARQFSVSADAGLRPLNMFEITNEPKDDGDADEAKKLIQRWSSQTIFACLRSTRAASTAMKEFYQVVKAILKEMEDFKDKALAANMKPPVQVAFLGGNLYIDPRKAATTEDIAADLKALTGSYLVHRLTNPQDGLASSLKKMSPFQTESGAHRFDVDEEIAPDHIYIIIPKDAGQAPESVESSVGVAGVGVYQKDAEDKLLRSALVSGLQFNGGNVVKGCLSKNDVANEAKEFDSLQIKGRVAISGYVPKGKFRPCFVPRELKDEEKSRMSARNGGPDLKAFTLHSSHLPVTVEMLLNTQAVEGTKSAYYSQIDVKADRVEEFKGIMKTHIEKARDKKVEPGCIRAEVFQVSNNATKFVLYEVFVNKAASDFHRRNDLYKEWGDFQVDGIESRKRRDVETESIGPWALQTSLPSSPKKIPDVAYFTTVIIREAGIERFLKLMEKIATDARTTYAKDCLRFDLLKDRDHPKRFVIYVAFVNRDAAQRFALTPNFAKWLKFKDSDEVDAGVETIDVDSSCCADWGFQG